MIVATVSSITFATAQSLNPKKWRIAYPNFKTFQPVIGAQFNIPSSIDFGTINTIFNQKGVQTRVAGNYKAQSLSLSLGRNMYLSKSWFDNVVNEEARQDKFMYPKSSTSTIGISPIAFAWHSEELFGEVRPLLELSNEKTILFINEKVHNGTLTNYLNTFNSQYNEVSIEGSSTIVRSGITGFLGHNEWGWISFSLKYTLSKNEINFDVPELPTLQLPKWEFSMGLYIPLKPIIKTIIK